MTLTPCNKCGKLHHSGECTIQTFILTSQVTTTYEHRIEAESLDEAKMRVEEGEDDGVETNSSSPQIIYGHITKLRAKRKKKGKRK